MGWLRSEWEVNEEVETMWTTLKKKNPLKKPSPEVVFIDFREKGREGGGRGEEKEKH